MDVQSQLLFIGSSAKALKLWWQNEKGLADWQCGQQAKDKLHIYCSQAHKMTFALI